jgi:hypothetical protein
MELEDVLLEIVIILGWAKWYNPYGLAGPNYSQDCKIVLLCFAFVYRKTKVSRLAHS